MTDTEEMSEEPEEEIPEAPVTAEELIARWADRDAGYARRRRPLDLQTAESVRQGRMREANHLPNPRERARIWAKAVTWVPPLHPDFGSMKDWLE